MKTINIMGVKYKLQIKNKKDEIRLKNCNGFCDFYEKLIVVENMQDDENDSESCRNLEFYTKQCIRHEVIHAFMYESGLAYNSGGIDSWSMNEEMIDWIAIQFPKILEVCKVLNCL